MREVAAASCPVHLGLAEGGVFPPAGSARVVWLGLTPRAELIALAGRIEKALAPLGFPPERRPFTPHLTLGRAEPGAVFDRAILGRGFALAPRKSWAIGAGPEANCGQAGRPIERGGVAFGPVDRSRGWDTALPGEGAKKFDLCGKALES